MNKIKLAIGDFSGDGHGHCDHFIFSCNKKVEDVREAFFKAKEQYPNISPDTLCSDYEESTISEDIHKKISEMGFLLFDECGEWWGTDEFAQYAAWFICLGDPELKLEMIGDDAEFFHFYGYDDKKRHINFFGYGLLG